jgi:hypothetical protein
MPQHVVHVCRLQVYSFALNPPVHQPSGYFGRSGLQNPYLRHNTVFGTQPRYRM